MTKLFILLLVMCEISASVWNSPYSSDKRNANVLFSVFDLPYKHLDPVVSYSQVEARVISQILEPVLAYNYLKRPYVLEPLTLKNMPLITYLDKNKNELDEESEEVAYSLYTFSLREDIRYQNHPSFVLEEGRQLYGQLSEDFLEDIETLDDFPKTATRKLEAKDYVYAIKRMGVRQNQSPILDVMQGYIVGLDDFSKKVSLLAKEKKEEKSVLDLRDYDIEGVKVLDAYTFTILLKKKYPQFLYWMAMNFFAPIPWEADLFYQQQGLKVKNISFDTSPVGTGAYYIAEYDPSKILRLKKNPNFHDDFYPTLSKAEAKASNVPEELLQDMGKKLPFIDEVIYSLEKESIPLWNKFLQGYYDASGISSDAFGQVINVSNSGSMGLSTEMKSKGIQLKTYVEPNIYYVAFNMLDPVVGGYSDEAKKLRQAMSIVQNEEEYISIFRNERGIAAQSPIPPKIFGHLEGEKGTNSVIYDWVEGKRERKSLAFAKQLLVEAGYPEGISKKTGKPLVLNYDVTATGPDERALMDWRRKQFGKLGIQLVIRGTDYNRFQDKLDRGKAQIFSFGWGADYPDPENFLFLLYGPNGSVTTKGAGVNYSNYDNPKFNVLFEEIKTMKNSPKRLALIEKMIKIVQEDAPWVWGFHPKRMALYHAWVKNVLPHPLSSNTMKYKRVDATVRMEKQVLWNQPVLFPLLLILLFPLMLAYPLYRAYQTRQQKFEKVQDNV